MSEERQPAGEEFDPGLYEDADEVEENGPDEGSDSAPDGDAGESSDGGPQADTDEASQPQRVERRRQAQVRGRSASEEIRALRARAQAAETARLAAERERDLWRTQQNQVSEQQRRAEEEQRLALMGPEERIDYRFRQMQEQNQRELQSARFQLWDTADQERFDRELATQPRLGTAYERGRERFEELRRILPGASRLDLLDKVLGEQLRQNYSRAVTRQERRSETAARQNQTVNPGASRGNVAPARTRTGRRADWSHMRNVLI